MLFIVIIIILYCVNQDCVLFIMLSCIFFFLVKACFFFTHNSMFRASVVVKRNNFYQSKKHKTSGRSLIIFLIFIFL